MEAPETITVNALPFVGAFFDIHCHYVLVPVTGERSGSETGAEGARFRHEILQYLIPKTRGKKWQEATVERSLLTLDISESLRI